MKVFVSLPHHGLSEEEIMTNQKAAMDILEKDRASNPENFPEGEPLELLDTIHNVNAPSNPSRLWYLGEAIKKLDQAEVVYFYDNWYKAKGCWVEFIAAHLYNKEVVYDYPSNRAFRAIENILDIISSLFEMPEPRMEGDDESSK